MFKGGYFVVETNTIRINSDVVMNGTDTLDSADRIKMEAWWMTTRTPK